MSKLTLSAGSQTILLAKEYARRHNTSVSALFASFVQGLARQATPDTSPADETSTLRQLTGVVDLDKQESYDDLRRRAVRQRYGV
jgi:hypothetical protein